MSVKPPPEVANAVHELRFLLNRGYSRPAALNVVSNHYRFPLEIRHFLARCVFSEKEIEKNSGKSVGIAALRGKRLGVDGYNLLITVESILNGKVVVACDDGYVRDLRAVFGKYHRSHITTKAIPLIVSIVKSSGAKSVAFLFDKQVSHSGKLASEFKQMIKLAGLKGTAKAVAGVDMKLRRFEIVASSDRAVIERARNVWDIPAEILKTIQARVIDLKKID